MIERADYVIDIGPKAGNLEAKLSVSGQQKLEIKYNYRTIFER
jgi:excinuclease UvrABC ATPase subunit